MGSGWGGERPAAAAALFTLAALLAAGCAAEQKMTFAEAGLSGGGEPDLPPPPPAPVPAPNKVASEPPSGPPIDGTLLAFAAEARSRRGRPAARRGSGFPDEAVDAWSELARELERYLDRPMPQTPLLELVRARVTVESELEFDRRRYGPPPAGLAGALDAVLTRLAARAQAARALGDRMVIRTPPPALRWPIDNAGLSSLFGMRVDPIDGKRRMHFGIDLAAEAGRVVGAAAKGYVIRAGWMAGYGQMVEVHHSGDLTSRYGHLSVLLCRPGDAVEAGRPLGLVGRTGRATGPHLHFEVWHGGEARDPLAYLNGRPPGSTPDDDRVARR